MNNQTIAALKAARHLIATRGWTQNAEARNEHGAICDPMSYVATCYCSIGALKRVTYSRDRVYAEALELLARVVFPDVPIPPGAVVGLWNDNYGRTPADVLQKFDEAIRISEELQGSTLNDPKKTRPDS